MNTLQTKCYHSIDLLKYKPDHEPSLSVKLYDKVIQGKEK